MKLNGMTKRFLSAALALILTLGCCTMMATSASAAETQTWVKVTEAPADWSGTYLIVCETSNVIFDGSLTKLDGAEDIQSVTIADGTITGGYEEYSFTIAPVAGGYSIQSKSGIFIGGKSGSNTLQEDKATASVNTITMNGDGTVAIVSNTSHLRYNSDSGQHRFRYFKSSSYSNQEAICLYKLEVPAGPMDEKIDETGAYINISAPYRTFVFDKYTYIRYYFNFGASAEGYTECGIEYWNSADTTAEPEVIKGSKADGDGKLYTSLGAIAPANINDTQRYRLYVIVDGTKYMTAIQSFDLAAYITYIGESNPAYAMAVKLQEYGTAAAAYFNK